MAQLNHSDEQGCYESEEHCSICGRVIRLDVEEAWYTPEGTPFTVRLSSTVLGSCDTSIGKIDICEDCYKNRRHFEFFQTSDLVAIHAEFARMYQHMARLQESIRSYRWALALERDVELLLELGAVYENVGDVASARTCYRQVLSWAPDCEYARECLKSLGE